MSKLPFDRITERTVLGCILQRPELIIESAGLSEHYFWLQPHRLIFRAAREVLASPDEIPGEAFRAFVGSKVRSNVGDEARFESLTVREYIAGLLDEAVSPEVQFRPAAEELCELYQRRRLAESARSLYGHAVAGGMNASEVIAFAHDQITEVSGLRPDAADELEGAIDEWFETTSKSIEGEKSVRRQAPTNIWAVDKLLDGGGTFGHYTVFAAKKKMGKTRLTTRIAYELLRAGYPVDHYAIEMTQFEMISLYATCITGRGYRDLSTHTENSDEQYKRTRDLVKARGDLRELPVRLFSGRRSIREIELNTYARAAREDLPLVVIVDYLQIVRGEGSTEYERVTEVTKSLSELAPSTGAWVIATAQFNRESALGMPHPHQLRSSGQIEQDVDELLIFHRPAEELEEATDEQKKRGLLWCALNRHGGTGRAELSADLVRLQFGHVDDYPI